MSHTKIFLRAFLIVLGVQIVLYGLFQLLGTDKSSHGLSSFGDGYLWIYFVPWIASAMDKLGVGRGGLKGLNAIIDIAPLAVSLIYSAICASIVLFTQSKRATH